MKHTENERYSRQIFLPEVGEAGQAKLRGASVLVVGVGGLGSPAALYLAGAGVGRLGLVDADEVTIHNLHRQILYRTRDEGKKKVHCAAESLVALNPETIVEASAVRLSAANAKAWVERYDIVLDGTDRFESRYLLHDTCFALGKPYVYGAIHQFEGQVSLFEKERGPCYRCLYPEPPAWVPNCAEAGVLGVLPGIVGILQATEALKRILEIGESLAGRLLVYDALKTSFSDFRFEKKSGCALCGQNPVKQLPPLEVSSLPPAELSRFLNETPQCQVVDVREAEELAGGTLPGYLHIPLKDLPERMEKNLRRDRPVLVYCQRGLRSQAAGKLLQANGFSSVRHLEGGYESVRQ